MKMLLVVRPYISFAKNLGSVTSCVLELSDIFLISSVILKRIRYV